MKKKPALVIGLLFFVSILNAGDDTVPLSKKTPDAKPGQSSDKTFEQMTTKPEVKDLLEKGGSVEVKPYLASFDTYGSERINEAIVREALGPALTLWISHGLENHPDGKKEEAQLTEEIKKKYGFPLVAWSVQQYPTPDNFPVHITLDVVEKDDLGKRASFIPLSNQSIPDPGGLITSWQTYQAQAMKLVEKGEIEPGSENCKGISFYCPFGHKHSKLKPFEKIFVDGVKKHTETLVKVSKTDGRPKVRVAALFLLLYSKDGNKVVEALVDRVTDPDFQVRNSALQILEEIAETYTDIIIPIAPVAKALEYPTVTERIKALYIIHLLVSTTSVKEVLKANYVPVLIQLMSTKQPEQITYSHGILRKISGQEFNATEILAWTNWYKSLGKK